jgi:hypothetical protein
MPTAPNRPKLFAGQAAAFDRQRGMNFVQTDVLDRSAGRRPPRRVCYLVDALRDRRKRPVDPRVRVHVRIVDAISIRPSPPILRERQVYDPQ